jgi:hypothetical protein
MKYPCAPVLISSKMELPTIQMPDRFLVSVTRIHHLVEHALSLLALAATEEHCLAMAVMGSLAAPAETLALLEMVEMEAKGSLALMEWPERMRVQREETETLVAMGRQVARVEPAVMAAR